MLGSPSLAVCQARSGRSQTGSRTGSVRRQRPDGVETASRQLAPSRQQARAPTGTPSHQHTGAWLPAGSLAQDVGTGDVSEAPMVVTAQSALPGKHGRGGRTCNRGKIARGAKYGARSQEKSGHAGLLGSWGPHHWGSALLSHQGFWGPLPGCLCTIMPAPPGPQAAQVRRIKTASKGRSHPTQVLPHGKKGGQHVQGPVTRGRLPAGRLLTRQQSRAGGTSCPPGTPSSPG